MVSPILSIIIIPIKIMITILILTNLIMQSMTAFLTPTSTCAVHLQPHWSHAIMANIILRMIIIVSSSWSLLPIIIMTIQIIRWLHSSTSCSTQAAADQQWVFAFELFCHLLWLLLVMVQQLLLALVSSLNEILHKLFKSCGPRCFCCWLLETKFKAYIHDFSKHYYLLHIIN